MMVTLVEFAANHEENYTEQWKHTSDIMSNSMKLTEMARYRPKLTKPVEVAFPPDPTDPKFELPEKTSICLCYEKTSNG